MLKNYLMRMQGGGDSVQRHSFGWMLWSWLGAFCGILLVAFFNKLFLLSATENIFLIGSFGASAVLIYGTPHVPYAQPRNLLGGHVISALTAVTIIQYIHLPIEFQAALAVSTAILLMHLTCTLHPPGGATALIGVIGGERVHDLGYEFVFTPVLSGALIMLLVAILVNGLSADRERNYPKSWW